MKLTAEKLNAAIIKFRRKYRATPTTIYVTGDAYKALVAVANDEYKIRLTDLTEYCGMLVKPSESNKLVIEEPVVKDGRTIDIKKLVEVDLNV